MLREKKEKQAELDKERKENGGITNDAKEMIMNIGYTESDIQDFIDEYHQGGSKIPKYVKELMSKGIERNDN